MHRLRTVDKQKDITKQNKHKKTKARHVTLLMT